MAYSKIRKHRGRKDCGGHKKKRRGAGNRGGRGNAGLSKHKRSWVLKNDPNHFTKPSMKPRQDKPGIINLSDIDNLITREGKLEFDLSKCKVLGNGSISKPVTIKALSFSGKAREKIEKAGGKAEALYQEAPQEGAEPEQKAEAELPKKSEA